MGSDGIRGEANSSFISLILKDKKTTSLNRFDTISLYKTSYKILTKIIASHLKKLIPRIISKNQSGFLDDRKIIDNIIIMQEVIHSSIERKAKGMAIKLELANSFNRVRHNFLFIVLISFGFNEMVIQWVNECIGNPWISPLVNIRPTSFFKISKVLSQ